MIYTSEKNVNDTVNMIDVEVAFALPDQQKIIDLKVPQGTTVHDAAVMSGIVNQFEGLVLEGMPMGIFGKTVKNPQAEEIKQGQRVEIYRPLTIDPKVARANRAAKAAAKAKLSS
ncbi:MAG: RnfH family protein [Gammaproteobacteria bacterium]|nr:RnfH family protein [Gammaproteobacteria bacterium]